MSTMDQTIESLDLNISKVFSDFYVVPSFQREYVWEERQVEQILQDVFDEFSDDGMSSEYFVGSMVVCPGKDDVIELIDGQQRMTTFYLFLCAVRDHLAALGADPIEVLTGQIAASSVDDLGRDVFRYHVHLQYDDSCGVLNQIATGNADLSHIPQTRSVKNIISAYETIRSFLRTEFGGDAGDVRQFYAYFSRRVKLVRTKTESVAHALKVFETINDRGVGLDSMDLLKNLMFMRAGHEDYEKLKVRWKGLVDTLYAAREKPLRFLRYFVFATYGVDRLREDEIYRWFITHEDQCGYDKNPLAFVDALCGAALAYKQFIEGRGLDGTVNPYLVNLGYLSGMARQQLILLLAGQRLGPADFSELCRQIENLFFAYVITREPTKEFERSFARWAPELRQVRDRADLGAFIAARIRPAKESLAARYELAFRQLTESSIQKYRMRYILAKLTQYVDEQAYSSGGADLTPYMHKVDIEHILPQTPGAAVIASFNQPESIRDYIPRLGNLTLLESSINSSVGNGLFSEKKPPYGESKFLLTKTIAYPVAVGANTAIDRAVRELLTFQEWTSDAIDRRQEMLTQLAKRVWDMPDRVPTSQ